MGKDEQSPQAAALAFRDQKICLVTTRSGKGLIIPKGHVPVDTSPAELAAREAWEEAGLIGQIARRPFAYQARANRQSQHRQHQRVDDRL